MNIYVLEAFLEVVRLKSISKASEKLSITHPALSKQMRKLEAYYGVTLFKRSASGVELTDSGRVLHERVGPIAADLARLRSELLASAGGARLRLGSLPSLAAAYLPGSIVAMERKGLKADVIVRQSMLRRIGRIPMHVAKNRSGPVHSTEACFVPEQHP